MDSLNVGLHVWQPLDLCALPTPLEAGRPFHGTHRNPRVMSRSRTAKTDRPLPKRACPHSCSRLCDEARSGPVRRHWHADGRLMLALRSFLLLPLPRIWPTGSRTSSEKVHLPKFSNAIVLVKPTFVLVCTVPIHLGTTIPQFHDEDLVKIKAIYQQGRLSC